MKTGMNEPTPSAAEKPPHQPLTDLIHDPANPDTVVPRHSGQAVDRQGEWQKRRYPHARPDSDSWDIYAGETLIVGDLMEDECDKIILPHNAAIHDLRQQLEQYKEKAWKYAKSRTYLIWSGMVGRCHRPSDTNYRWYGAKGVTVCDRWRKFENFFEDMGEVPVGAHIHRLNNATIYSKETCQWISEHEHIGRHNTERGWGARLTRSELIDRVSGLQTELAAEHQRTEQAEGAAHHMEACRSLLNVSNDDVLYEAIDDMQDQLLSALAAIEKHNNSLYTRSGLGAKIEVDLSLLHQHDAEVRKPLVEALQILLDSAGCLCGEEPEIPEEISAQFDINLDDARKVHDALAKVKEKS